MTFRLGLTGSIGMGKSTTARMFVDEGCALWDADAAVHRMYAKGGAAVGPIGAAFPSAIVDGAVSRPALKTLIAKDGTALRRIEDIVHPLVAADRAAFSDETTADIAVFDVPLLFETGGHETMDAVACVTIDPDTQRDRVLSRPGMSAHQFDQIVAMQMPSAEKEDRSDYVIVTDTPDHAREQVRDIVAKIRKELSDA